LGATLWTLIFSQECGIMILTLLMRVVHIGGWSAETGRKQDEALGTRPARQ